MGERKVLSKYYSPEFDPSKLRRARRPKNQQTTVRIMLPMSLRCNTCGNFIYRGTKFNSRKELALGEAYLGIQVFRFYFKCTRCSAEISMKTDPRDSDYVVECGARRNREPWRDEDERLDMAKRRRVSEETDAMKALENRASDSKREADISAALAELKSVKSRRAAISVDAMLEALQGTSEAKEEDEAVLKSVVFHNSAEYVHRVVEDEYEDVDLREKVSDKLPIKPNKFVIKTSTVTLSVVKKPPKTEETNKLPIKPNKFVRY